MAGLSIESGERYQRTKMKRSLISQMRNEWRSNIWLIVELTVVSVVIWSSIWMLLEIAASNYGRKGYDTNDVYSAAVHVVPEESDGYVPYADSLHNEATDLDLLMANLRSKPQVEVLGIGINSTPFNYNYFGDGLTFSEKEEATDSVKYYAYNGNGRRMSPEVPLVFRWTGSNGETPEQLADILRRGEYIISPFEWSPVNSSPEKFLGKDLIFGRDSANIVRVGAIAPPIRRSDYESCNGMIALPWNIHQQGYREIILRVRTGQGKAFIESLTKADKRIGNTYVVDFNNLNERAESAHLHIRNAILSNVVITIFLLLIIFLGFLGTFWFRTQERVGEIAIRKTCGAKNGDIMRRFLGEGMLMLLAATVIAFLVDMALLKLEIVNQVNDIPHGWTPWVAMAISPLLTALIVGIGILVPARKAMKTDPALALKDQ